MQSTSGLRSQLTKKMRTSNPRNQLFPRLVVFLQECVCLLAQNYKSTVRNETHVTPDRSASRTIEPFIKSVIRLNSSRN